MAETRGRTGRPDKRDAVLSGARTVFARDGFSRASMDAVAVQAGVSTRTIYKHFGGKEDLFAATLIASATTVADAFRERLATIEDGDPETQLVQLGLAFAAQEAEAPEHFALIGRVRAERDHFPADVVAAWRTAGPLAVRTALADRLTRLPGLAVEDPMRAAAHLGALVTAEGNRPSERTVAAAVAVFLRGYAG